jgi:hypothetical protein
MIDLDKEFSDFIKTHQTKCEAALKATEAQMKKNSEIKSEADKICKEIKLNFC